MTNHPPPPDSGPSQETLIERLRERVKCHRNGVKCCKDALLMEEAADALHSLSATRSTLEAERDERVQEVEHWVTRYNELEQWRIATRHRADSLEAQLAKVLGVLRDYDGDQDNEEIGGGPTMGWLKRRKALLSPPQEQTK